MLPRFKPVTVNCPMCGRFYVEWCTADECKGKTRHWRPKAKCDVCCMAWATAEQREDIQNAMCKRRRQCHAKYAEGCDTTFLSEIHKQMLHTTYDEYYFHKPFYTDQPRGLAKSDSLVNTHGHTPR